MRPDKQMSRRMRHGADTDRYLTLYPNGVLAASSATAFTAIGTANMNLLIGMRAGGIEQDNSSAVD